MNKEIALKLKEKAEETAVNFSNPGRPLNMTQETFKVSKIISLGDELACVIFDKSSGKRALAVYVYVKDYWIYFFPKAGHLLGWEQVKNHYFEVEAFNFSKNFEPVKLSDLV